MKNSIAYLFFCIILIACQSKTNTDNTKIKKDENRAFIEITKESEYFETMIADCKVFSNKFLSFKY